MAESKEKKQKAFQTRTDAYEDFEAVHELVATAYAKYEEDGDLKEQMIELGNAIIKAAQKVGT